jgi:hypothetical protein
MHPAGGSRTAVSGVRNYVRNSIEFRTLFVRQSVRQRAPATDSTGPVAARADRDDTDGYWTQAMTDAAYALEAALTAPADDQDDELDALMASRDDEEG